MSGLQRVNDIISSGSRSKDGRQVGVDVILAADCTYSEDISTALVHTIELLLKAKEKHQDIPTSSSSSTTSSTTTAAVLTDPTQSVHGVAAAGVAAGGVSSPCSLPCLDALATADLVFPHIEPFALVAATIRNLVTFEHFVYVLRSTVALTVVDITDSVRNLTSPVFYIPNRDSIRIVRVMLAT